MDVEPDVDPPRPSEALLLVVDAAQSPKHSPQSFQQLREAAMRTARTRLISSTQKDDLIAVLKSGSSSTSNRLALEQPGGYLGIEVLLRPVSKSIRAVSLLSDMQPGTDSSNLLNILDVCGDLLVDAAASRASNKRIMLFTDGLSIREAVTKEDEDDFQATLQLYTEHSIKVDVICHCSTKAAQDAQQYDAKFDSSEKVSVELAISHSHGFKHALLLALAKSTGGIFLPYDEAKSLVDRPVAKVKRATAKFRGVLNIGDMLKIPVKRFSHVSCATFPSAKKISWEASVNQGKPVPVLVETQRVAVATDDTPLEPEQIINAYPYGPELVPEHNEVDSYSWSIHIPRCLDALGFVPQASVPHHLFMDSVDVVVAMPGVKEARALLKNLVLAMHVNELGILARSVKVARGGVPNLCYLWPKVELSKDGVEVKNFFLFAVDVPMREDIRELNFASLEDVFHKVPDSANEAMDKYVSAMMLDAEDEMDEDDEDDSFWPPDECNPNIDRFNTVLVQRVIDGETGTEFPPLSEWQSQITNPTSYIKEENRDAYEQAIRDLKSILPVLPARQKQKRGQRVYRVLNGDMASLVDYLPEEADDSPDREGEGQGQYAQGLDQLDNFGDDTSIVTDLEIMDVGAETPVSDFKNLVKKGKFRFAAASLLVVVRRLIREVIDDDKAMRCLQALRKTSVDEKDVGIFNDFIASLVERCKREDAIGNRTCSFFRFVHRHGAIANALNVISLPQPKDGLQDSNAAHNEYLKDVSAQIADLAAKNNREHSTSMTSR